MKTLSLGLLSLLLILFGLSAKRIYALPQSNTNTDGDSIRIQIEQLLRSAGDQQEVSPDLALQYSREAFQLASQLRNKHLIDQSGYEIALAHFNLGNIDSCMAHCEMILDGAHTDKMIQALTSSRMCIACRKMGKYAAAFRYANSAMEIYRTLADSIGLAGAILNRAKVYQATGENETAIKDYYRVLKLYEATHDSLAMGQVLGLIGNVYMDIDEDRKGMDYYLKSIDLLKHFPEHGLYADALNNYGIVFYDRQDYDSAEVYFQKALQVYRQTDKKDAVAVAYQNLGITYVYLNNKNEGLKMLHKALQMFDELKLDDDKLSAWIDMGRAFLKLHKADSSAFYLTKALSLSKTINNTYSQKDALLLLHRLYLQDRDFAKSLKFYKQYVDFRDSIDNMKMRQKVQELEVRYKTAEHEKEIQQLKAGELLDKAYNRLLTIGIVGISILLILILIILWIKRKKDIQLQQQKLLIFQKEEALSKAELARREAARAQLENEVEFKNKQLATHALNMMQKNKLLQDMTEHISVQMNSLGAKEKNELKNFKYQLEQGLNVDKDWDLFKMYFEQINERFYDKLKRRNPSLTGNDYRLCALIKLNMNIKEMASVLNISADSLKNARYRLKKKLHLKPDESLPEYIRNL